MIGLAVLAGFLVVIVITLAYLLGFQIGGQAQSRITNVRSETTEAVLRMDELTRAAFEAMTNHSNRNRRSNHSS